MVSAFISTLARFLYFCIIFLSVDFPLRCVFGMSNILESVRSIRNPSCPFRIPNIKTMNNVAVYLYFNGNVESKIPGPPSICAQNFVDPRDARGMVRVRNERDINPTGQRTTHGKSTRRSPTITNYWRKGFIGMVKDDNGDTGLSIKIFVSIYIFYSKNFLRWLKEIERTYQLRINLSLEVSKNAKFLCTNFEFFLVAGMFLWHLNVDRLMYYPHKKLLIRSLTLRLPKS